MQLDPDRHLFLDALAAGLPLPSARKVGQLTKSEGERVAMDEPDAFHQARRSGALARGAPHLVAAPEMLAEHLWPNYFTLIAAGKRPSQACRELGVRPIQAYLARQASTRFAEVERAAGGAIVEQVEDALLANALEGETKAILAYLEARAPELGYGSSKGKAGVQIGTLNVNMDPSDARARLDAIRKELGAGPDDGIIDAEIVDGP